jgi:hypothetical protein
MSAMIIQLLLLLPLAIPVIGLWRLRLWKRGLDSIIGLSLFGYCSLVIAKYMALLFYRFQEKWSFHL